MKGYLTIKYLRVLGAPVHIHWAALAVIAILFLLWIRTPLLAFVTIGSYFGLILLHEAGHAYLARRLGWRPRNIYLGVFHGLCEADAPDNPRDECLFAWGGVLAQLAVAVPLIVLSQTTPLTQLPPAGPIVVFLGFFSVIIAAVNLMPFGKLDGVRAWRLIPLEIHRRRRTAAAKKSAEEVIGRLKKRAAGK